MKKKLTINCSCDSDEYLKFIYWEEDDEDEIYIWMSGCEINGLRNRLKVMWQILTKGEFENYGVIAGKPEAQKIADYLNEFIKNQLSRNT